MPRRGLLRSRWIKKKIKDLDGEGQVLTNLGRVCQDRGERNKTLANFLEDRDCLPVGRLVYYATELLET